MTTIRLDVESEEEMIRLGETLAGLVGKGALLALTGELGAGKTRLVKGLARGLGVDPDDVTSPTFTMIAEHRGRLPLYHMDFYRLGSAREAAGIGIEEYFDYGGVCAVEWADRLPQILPRDSIWIEIAVTGPSSRTVLIEGEFGSDFLSALEPFHHVIG